MQHLTNQPDPTNPPPMPVAPHSGAPLPPPTAAEPLRVASTRVATPGSSTRRARRVAAGAAIVSGVALTGIIAVQADADTNTETDTDTAAVADPQTAVTAGALPSLDAGGAMPGPSSGQVPPSPLDLDGDGDGQFPTPPEGQPMPGERRGRPDRGSYDPSAAGAPVAGTPSGQPNASSQGS